MIRRLVGGRDLGDQGAEVEVEAAVEGALGGLPVHRREHHAGRIVSRGELTEHLYDQDFDRDSNTIEVFVGRIRKKLGVDIIQTVRGLGYLLTPPNQ